MGPEDIADPDNPQRALVPPSSASEDQSNLTSTRQTIWPSVPMPATSQDSTSDSAPKQPRRKGRAFAFLVLVLTVGLIGGLIGGWLSGSRSSSVTIAQNSSAPSGAVLPSGMTIPQLVKKVLPAVVSIDVKNRNSEDQGTGMIISANGMVITNNHVIAAAANGGSITITRSGSTTAQAATLVGAIPANDVALLQIQGATNLPTVTIGDSDKAQVGDAVVAIGNALGLAAGTPTVTQGIVSALGRTVTAGDQNSTATETLTNMIQTDAAINPGNSGGPLLDAAGNVIGMNTAVASGSGSGSSAQNIGFAIPSNTVEQLLPQLESGGATSKTPTTGYLGVEITTMTPDLKNQYHLTPSAGAVVLSVGQGSPAASAGIQQGDVIVSADGTAITTAVQLTNIVKATAPGTSLRLEVYRGTRKLTINAKVGTSPSN